MTTQAERITQLEEAIARLEALNLSAPPAPTPTAVDPDGYPSHVAPGELVESAWGNAVSDKLRVHYNLQRNTWTQYGNQVSNPISGSTYQITWPEPFVAPPAVSIMNGDAVAIQAFFQITSLTATSVQFVATTREGTGITGLIRFIWMAHGVKLGMTPV